MLSLNTFGKTPAAEHLVRKLNEVQDEKTQASYIRSVGIAIKNCNTNLKSIRDATHMYFISAKVAANLLRLLRAEANTINVCNDAHISDLARNVIIGNIKRAIRELTVIRKIENATSSLQKMKTKCQVEDVNDNYTTYSYMGYEVGVVHYEKEFRPFAYPIVHDHVTHELLHKRSQARRARKGKV